MPAPGCNGNVAHWEINTEKNRIRSKNIMFTYAKHNINVDIYDLF